MRLRSTKDLRRDQGGATAVEFSLVALPFLLLLLGCIEFSRLIWTQNVLQQVALSGVRCMALSSGSCASAGAYDASMTLAVIESDAQKMGVTLQNSDIMLDNSTTCGGVAGFSSVTLNYTFQSPVPLLPMLSSRAMKISACFPNQS